MAWSLAPLVKMAPIKIFVCTLYLIAGPALILLNKHILSTVGFHFPMTVSCVGLVTTSVLIQLLVSSRRVVVEHRERINCSFYVKNMLTVGLCSAVTLATGNMVYMHLTVAFIQMLKAFTPVVTMILLYTFRVETPHMELVLAVVGISLGTCGAVYGEMAFNVTGFSLMMVSEVAEGMKLVLTQLLLKNLKFSVFEGLYWLVPPSILGMLPAILLWEYPQMLAEGALPMFLENASVFILAGLLGFAVNVLSFFVIQLTSSVTLKVLAVARTAGLVLFCAAFLQESVSSLEAFGYTVSLLCFLWYNYLKMGGSLLTGLGLRQNADNLESPAHLPVASDPFSKPIS